MNIRKRLMMRFRFSRHLLMNEWERDTYLCRKRLKRFKKANRNLYTRGTRRKKRVISNIKLKSGYYYNILLKQKSEQVVKHS